MITRPAIVVRAAHFEACRIFADECVPPGRGLEGGLSPRRLTQRDDVLRQRIGAVALALFLGRDPRDAIDWHCEPHMRADVRAARSIDVTTSGHPDCSLLVVPRRPLHGARLALARVELLTSDGAAVRLLGWVAMDERRTFQVVEDDAQATRLGAPVGARWWPLGELRPMHAIEGDA